MSSSANNHHNDSFEVQIRQALDTAFINGFNNSSVAYQPQFVSNNYTEGRKVLSAIESELRACSSFVFSVAFVTMSGITPLLQTLERLESKGIPGKILTTDYLAFSDPKALRKLNAFSNIEVRVFLSQEDSRSNGFHTKGYLFEYEQGVRKAIIGSSNLTADALAVNKEWNVKLVGANQGKVLADIDKEFTHLWHQSHPLESVIDGYELIYREKKTVLQNERIISYEQAKLEPNTMQTQFIEGLLKIIDSGDNKALLISATGTGKTYASAFAVRHMNPKRLLFLAHREQLLKQSIKSFRHVIGRGKTLGLLSGNSRELAADYLFATMQTMSKDDILAQFDPHDFDMIVIDEVHRAGAKSYEKILAHFEPEFLLGMTASPDRPDGFDIYKLFDNNIAFEIRLQGALEENLLCPFHYFGITDLAIDGQTIGDDSLDHFSYLTSNARIDHILEKTEFYGYSGDRAKGLMFCRTNEEARELASQLRVKGVRALALSGANTQDERELAIERLIADPGSDLYDDRLDYILTVDIFNEGVDIPPVNQVVMLRPTQSPIVFVQQLGRGLRRVHDKEYVVVIDFIGNYANNYMIPLALSGDRSYNKDSIRKYVMEGSRVIPGASTVHFDEISERRIFESINKCTITLQLLKEKYTNLKHKLGKVPRLVDFIDHSEIDPQLIVDKKGSYQDFLLFTMGEKGLDFDEDELVVLRFLSSFVMKGMRPTEALMLKRLLLNNEYSEESVNTDMHTYFHMPLKRADYESACNLLDMNFAVSQTARKKFGSIAFIDLSQDGAVIPSTKFEQMLKRDVFRSAVLDLVEFSLKKYASRYLHDGGAFKLYEKYTRRDACQLLNWKHDDSSTVYGYRIKFGTCPIFVTYNKDEDISRSTQYEDRFIDPQYFSWMTRSNLTIASTEVQQIINADDLGLDIHLFIKKGDNEGSDFYYMGKVHPESYRQTTIENDNGDLLPIVNFVFKLENPVREDLYDYLESDCMK